MSEKQSDVRRVLTTQAPEMVLLARNVHTLLGSDIPLFASWFLVQL